MTVNCSTFWPPSCVSLAVKLHAACRGAGQSRLLPQQRRQVETDEEIERAAGEVGFHQLVGDFARIVDSFLHRVLGDFVEDAAMDGLAFERSRFRQQLLQVLVRVIGRPGLANGAVDQAELDVVPDRPAREL